MDGQSSKHMSKKSVQSYQCEKDNINQFSLCYSLELLLLFLAPKNASYAC